MANKKIDHTSNSKWIAFIFKVLISLYYVTLHNNYTTNSNDYDNIYWCVRSSAK